MTRGVDRRAEDGCRPGPLSLPELLGLLVCPACRADVLGEGGWLKCGRCGARYPVVRGVPIMVMPVPSQVFCAKEEVHSGEGPPRRGWSRSWRQAIARSAARAPSYDPGQATRIQAMLETLGPAAIVLDLGCGGRQWGPRVIGMDVDALPHVRLVGDGHRLPFRDETLDGVICTGVLEHVDDAEAVTRELTRVLRAGGLAYVAVPFMQGYHPAGGTNHDYRRLTHIGLRRLLGAFEVVDEGIAGGPSSALAWILREYLALALAQKGPLYSLAHLVSGWLTAWMKYLDILLARRPAAHRIACGFYALVRKPAAGLRSDG